MLDLTISGKWKVFLFSYRKFKRYFIFNIGIYELIHCCLCYGWKDTQDFNSWCKRLIIENILNTYGRCPPKEGWIIAKEILIKRDFVEEFGLNHKLKR